MPDTKTEKTAPSNNQERYMATRAEVEELARRLGGHPAGLALQEMLTSSEQQEFEFWLPKEYIARKN